LEERWAASRGRPRTGRWPLAKYFLRLGDREAEAELEETPEGLRVNLDGAWRDVSLQRLGDSPRYLLVLDDRMMEVLVAEESQAFNVQIAGRSYEVETVRRRARARPDEGDQFIDGRWLLRAPLTGVVVETRAGVGDAVAQGDVLIVVEAMKMLNELRSRVSGTISAVHPEAGQRVEIGEILIEISETPEA
jgi:biotin carboxyl carrier protein